MKKFGKINKVQAKWGAPKKPVVLTFDDGHYNNYFYAYPIIEKYNFKANLNVIGCFSEYSTSSGDIDNHNYSYLTWSEIKTLHDSGLTLKELTELVYYLQKNFLVNLK